jgi:ribulose-5-phosphate 4-epimerase/fuculose-1-phosphate aldolase
MRENKIREQMAILATSLFDRGLTKGSSGNIGVRAA